MNDIKCPFCQQELESVLQLASAGGLIEEAYLLCSKCNIRSERKLWQELIRTCKALNVAICGLDQMTWGCDSSDAEHLLKEIKEITRTNE